MNTMEDLQADHVRRVHDGIADSRQCDRRIISEAALLQTVFRANLVPECVPRAALVFFSICAYPPFREANEETAAATAIEILASGGYGLLGDPTILEDLARGIQVFTTGEEEVEHWFRMNSGPTGIR